MIFGLLSSFEDREDEFAVVEVKWLSSDNEFDFGSSLSTYFDTTDNDSVNESKFWWGSYGVDSNLNEFTVSFILSFDQSFLNKSFDDFKDFC